MAKFKKTAKRTASSKGPNQSSFQAQAEGLAKMLGDSAQHVWLAGVGAFGRAQAEGGKLFETLVKEGMNLEQSARKFAGSQTDQVREAMETHVGQARDRAADTWDKLERVFEERVQRALHRLGVPGRDDLNDLSARVETLTAELRRQHPQAKKPAKRRTTRNLGQGRSASKATVASPKTGKAKTPTSKKTPPRPPAAPRG